MSDEVVKSTRAENSEKVAARLLMGADPEQEFSLESIAFELALPFEEVVAIINNPGFADSVRAISKARALVSIHTSGIEKLVAAVRLLPGDSKDFRLSVALLARLTGEAKTKPPVNLTFNFDSLRQKASQGAISVEAEDPFEVVDDGAANEFNTDENE